MTNTFNYVGQASVDGGLQKCSTLEGLILLSPKPENAQKPQNLQTDPEFVRSDFKIYIANLPQKAGVSPEDIRALVLKELTDNALDECDRAGRPGEVTITQDGPDTYTVTDQGRGFDDTPEQLARRFSLDKPMTSSKQWRKPTRGCVGNGLRVIVGSVVDGDRKIIVKTRNREVVLCPRLDGTTVVVSVKDIDWSVGTSITIEINPLYPDHDSMGWSELAIELARNSGEPFRRDTSVWWLDADHLALNMLSSIGTDFTVADFVSRLDRCKDRRIGPQITAMFGKGTRCRDLSRADAIRLLEFLREMVPEQINAKKLGPMGRDAWRGGGLVDGYACKAGLIQTGKTEPYAKIPVLVEVWTATEEPTCYEDDCKIFATHLTINRSPAICEYDANRFGKGKEATFTLGGTTCRLTIPRGRYSFAVNITTPYIPILGDNKNPDLRCFNLLVTEAINSTIKAAYRNNPPKLFPKPESRFVRRPTEKKVTQKEAFLAVLGNAVKRSRDGTDGQRYYFSQRSLFYRVRELMKEILPDEELQYPYFTNTLITDYESEYGDIDHMVRDPRGVFTEPHGGDVVSMGTASVDAYSRSWWKYSNVLFVEKQDLVTILRQVGFDDRWDCFLLSSKGDGTRAAKDLIDKISERDEPTKFFVLHDADAAGSLISQSLREATKARGARKVEVCDLGLFPWDAIRDGLPVEVCGAPVNKNGKKGYRPVAYYIKERDRNNLGTGSDEPNWERWLQTQRIEINAMTSEQIVKWLNAEFEKHGAAKVIPPGDKASGRLRDNIRTSIRDRIEDRHMAEIEKLIEKETDEEFNKLKLPEDDALIEKIQTKYKDAPSISWTVAVSVIADEYLQEVMPEEIGNN